MPKSDPYKVSVKDTKEASFVISVLSYYDLYLGDLICCNVCGLEIFNGTDWEEYEDANGRNIREIMDEEKYENIKAENAAKARV